jgi:hypothetical protein
MSDLGELRNPLNFSKYRIVHSVCRVDAILRDVIPYLMHIASRAGRQ